MHSSVSNKLNSNFCGCPVVSLFTEKMLSGTKSFVGHHGIASATFVGSQKKTREIT